MSNGVRPFRECQCRSTRPDMAGTGNDAVGQEPRARREGRGRLSSIDMLPDECDPDISWAIEALELREMPQTEILREFNARLADRGVRGVSKGAFSRWSLRRAQELKRQAGARMLMNIVSERVGPADRSSEMIAAIELVKYRILETLTATGEPDIKLLTNAALALNRLSNIGAREAEVTRRERQEQREEKDREAERAKADAAKAAEAIAEAGRTGVLTPETLQEISRRLGAV
ncbi:MAG: DUF3486 family protein [Thermomonas sp.]|uniref:phage protein Gp27 family protein n=1 Tax=Thermomonas sp. TaxID=1971895 RepID=UPI002636BA9D|nr:phage protein Gp27 family protein [Thermomonas sp.]MCC7097282.1 DUF3486 family protein [Thermomonas sp.]